ncbi:SH3 domain-containing protein [Streptomyces nigrescens]|uniref:SH3 domain-containing protein n=1 Tax=Streptomyces nigrescens TaxID=1920 RepID=UPI00224C9E0A|nr:SH3 domain-containing protein [Streptomyces libani]MCX5446850.1 SH3 domain-containing protein [Streptomyces libani]
MALVVDPARGVLVNSVSTSMRLRTVVAAVGAMAMAGLGVGTAYASEAPANKPNSEVAMVNGLNFRAGPDTSYAARGMLYANDEVEIITYRNPGPGQWDKVRLLRSSAGGLPAGSVGWVKQSYLTAPTCASGSDDQCQLYGGG